MNSPILAIPEIAENQNNKYITHNNAIAWLEGAMNDILVKNAIGAGPVNLSEAEATKYFIYRLSGASAAFNLVFPAQINANNAKRVFAVRNEDSADSATVKASTGTGATVVLAPGETAIIFQSYEDMYSLGVVNSYDLAFYGSGKPGDGAEWGKYVATRAFKLFDQFAGSVGHCRVNPTATAAFDVQKNGSSIGSVSISTGGTFTFTTTGSALESFAAGDRLTLVAPSPQDATLEDVSISFLGILG
jgi:hypothetical protein